MPMTSRERMLIALENGKPDRLPCQVHGWMNNYLQDYLGGADWYEANAMFGLDYAIYVSPDYEYSPKDVANWRKQRKDLGVDADGNHHWEETIHTPKGTLYHKGATNIYTEWETEPLIKTPEDFALWSQFYPVPIKSDFTQIEQAKAKLGEKGIIRSHPFSPGQGSPWQSFCCLVGTEEAIFLAMDEPDFVHHALTDILSKTIKATELWRGTPADMVETGGGAGSNTVISPTMFKEFCLPYDQKQHQALHDAGVKIVYHLCGGLMNMLDMVVENGADGLETMTPPSMGGDCDLAEASHRVGDRLFFIGGFDQNAGFEHGSPQTARDLVYHCFDATKEHGGFIIAPSDHFFHGNPKNIQAFADACKECRY